MRTHIFYNLVNLFITIVTFQNFRIVIVTEQNKSKFSCLTQFVRFRSQYSNTEIRSQSCKNVTQAFHWLIFFPNDTLESGNNAYVAVPEKCNCEIVIIMWKV